MLSKIRHEHLVSLIGYCNDGQERALIYQCMSRGTLADHLYKVNRQGKSNPPLPWELRLKVSIGAAHGLYYLHSRHRIIHRDVKSSNILLDEDWIAKISDFGLSKMGPANDSCTHISTNVKGTFGYLDPEYFLTRKLTRKSDVYAFGVVLFEVLSGRPAVDLGHEEEQHSLAGWARYSIREGKVDQLIDHNLMRQISPACLKVFVGIAGRCLHTLPQRRPAMADVVVGLELALALQQNTDPTEPVEEENAGRTYSDQGDRVISVDDISLPKGESDWTISETKLSEICEADIKLAKFDWVTIAAATNHFSSSNMVEHSGFTKVYKAVLPTGQIVAVKRRSPSSAEGLEEFKNEIVLLSNLQHRNIVKLIGYCIHGDENLLVQEFAGSTSLDTLIDEAQSRRRRLQWLLWPLRFKIIMGIARGLVYLHQDSGLRVVYRDLKSRNILLDSDMNPKITDFCFARTLVEHQYELETTKTVGTTSSYMPPEYFAQGKFSVKSDVYSFGIIVLEIVSGRRVWNLAYRDTMMFLPSYAWKLWNEANPLNLVDNLLGNAFSVDEALRCIQVGLLCTQRDPKCRPEMPSVLKILEGEEPQVELQVEQQRASPPREDLAGSSMHTDDFV